MEKVITSQIILMGQGHSSLFHNIFHVVLQMVGACQFYQKAPETFNKNEVKAMWRLALPLEKKGDKIFPILSSWKLASGII